MHLSVRFSTEKELKQFQDLLYEKSGQGVSFTGLLEAMVSEVTIVTAVHNIKSNKGSKTAGVDRMKMDKYRPLLHSQPPHAGGKSAAMERGLYFFMPFYNQEEIEKARQVDLFTYLQTCEPQELVHVSGNVYCTREHDSLRISNGKWCWFSRGIGGYSVLIYLIKVKKCHLRRWSKPL